MVRERLNDACPLFFWRVCLALILLAMSIGLVQVAGSATTLPLRGPDVHLNFLVVPPDLVRPSTLPPTSVTTSTSYNSNSLMSVFNLSTHRFQRTGFNAHLSTQASTHTFQRTKVNAVQVYTGDTDQRSAWSRPMLLKCHTCCSNATPLSVLLKCHTSISVAQMPHWLGREDSNLRVSLPKSDALPLGHDPIITRVLPKIESVNLVCDLR